MTTFTDLQQTVTALQQEHGARPFGACTGCGASLMVWADDPNKEPKDIAKGSSYCGPLGRGDYRQHTPNITMALAYEAVYLFGFLAGQATATGSCTCCHEPRLSFRYGSDREEWGHVDDQHFAEMRHIHVDGSSSDCDGRYSHGRVYRLNTGIAKWALRPSRALKGCEDEEPTWHDLVTYVFQQTAPVWSGRTTIDMDTEAGWMRWSTSTDEGGSGGEARICADQDCAYDDDRFRDHTAERMGY